MRKLFSAVLILCLLPVFAIADIDLSFMPYKDLVKLQKQIAAEIVKRPEWKETTVPAGDWVVGQDIPAGTYGIRNDNKKVYVNFTVWKKAVNDFKDGGLLYNQLLKNGDTYGKVSLEAGWIVSIDDPLVFTPPVSLGF